MGILDDAIREHLELKRRSGADPSEIERLEREALGPVWRGSHEAAASAAETHPAAVYDEPDWVDEDLPLPEPEWPAEDPLAVYTDDESAHPTSVVEPCGGDPLVAEPSTVLDPAPAPEPPEPPMQSAPPVRAPQPDDLDLPPAAPPPPPRATSLRDSPGQETVEYDVESEPEPAEGEDVLEETPEFLQDTPDHDRLWFEQKPPRDFDFDG